MIVNSENYYYNLLTTPYKQYTVKVDQNNSNPQTSCTYLDDAVGMTPGSADWDTKPIFRDIKPCVFKEGKVVYYLNPKDFTKKVDGTEANITGDDGDVMIEFPRFGYRIYTDDNDQLFISITDNPHNPDFGYYAFIRESDKSQQDKMYKGAFKASLDSTGTKLRSVANAQPIASKTIAQYRQLAQANGEGYDSTTAGSIIALQCLYMIKYCNRNGQTALGWGYVSASAATKTGGTVDKGMYYGNTTAGTEQMKFAGVEDFWGNIWEWVNGITSDENRNIVVNYGGENHIYQTNLTVNSDGYVVKVIGNTLAGFHNVKVGGSTTTYWCDYGYLRPSCILAFGGAWDNGLYAGPFRLYLFDAPSAAGAIVSSRIHFI